ncbi:MAG TPA: selenide, water dikinase SelD [Cyclobacteriaceae bacterium]|nr:selenide, water dikinase SelD [Cyclobacteriaceae bacterium]HRJ81980.1 selenide, water dikinase SelD [Cyclobacteriaceae bacterium]
MMDIKLTQFSHGSGCGCKIAPATLEKILQTTNEKKLFSQLLVGNESKDDAAVYELNDGTCIISTTDFFMPIVDDPFSFGAIAATNAISDVYAMGGKPIMALAILGWPVEKIPVEVAQQVLAGAQSVCDQANIPLAGGHSIDSPEPIFGLAVTGTVLKPHLKKNNTAKTGDQLYLTKPLGVGMISTAQKRGVAQSEDVAEAVRIMTTLNAVGEVFGTLPYVSAMTDVTGFGLLGHLLEVCEGSQLSAEITYSKIPLIKNISRYASKMIYPDNTMRNWQSFEGKVTGIGSESLLTLCDPQTSGGLLVCVDKNFAAEFERKTIEPGLSLQSFGKLIDKAPAHITIHD